MDRTKLTLYLLCAAVLALFWPLVGGAQENSGNTVYHLKIEGPIEHGVSAYLKRGLREATVNNASAVILEINTPGGRLDSALAMKDMLLDTTLPTIAYINHQALSAGALVALSAEKIYMSEGSVIGAAAPVLGDITEKAPEKVVSATRTAFAAAAEKRGRNKEIARAFVDETVEIPGLSTKDKLLSLTTTEALENGISDMTVTDLKSALSAAGAESASLVTLKPATAEKVVRFITMPEVASLLLTIGFLALLLEFKGVGFGMAGIVALTAYGLFFWGHMLADLAGLEETLLLGVGILLIAIEMFVLPGFGVAGLLGAAALFAGLFLSFFHSPGAAPMDEIIKVSSYLSVSVLIVIGGMVMIIQKVLGREKAESGGLVLRANYHGDPAPVAPPTDIPPPAGLTIGSKGMALTQLRPSGTAEFDENRVDVVTLGDYIEAGTPIVVQDIQDFRIIVRSRKM